MGWLTSRLRLWVFAAAAHFRAHWSSPSHFWSGVLGMIANNIIALGTIWAMLFAGKPNLSEQAYAYSLMTLVNMAGWGFIHIFLGGWISLDSRINNGGLDSALMTPRSPLAVSSIAESYLPAWGDLIMGVVGLVLFAFMKFGFVFFLNSILMCACVSLAFGGIFIALGSIGFFVRRSERVWGTLTMMIVSVNSYPIFDTLGSPLRWLMLFAPITAIGVIPARYLLRPNLVTFVIELGAGILLAVFGVAIFRLGLRRYQSTPAFTGQRV